MLVVTRKTRETVVIGENITITVTRIGAGQVRLGIDAPHDVIIRRGELLDQWHAAPAEATSRR